MKAKLYTAGNVYLGKATISGRSGFPPLLWCHTHGDENAPSLFRYRDSDIYVETDLQTVPKVAAEDFEPA